jgi:hypothetical protein
MSYEPNDSHWKKSSYYTCFCSQTDKVELNPQNHAKKIEGLYLDGTQISICMPMFLHKLMGWGQFPPYIYHKPNQWQIQIFFCSHTRTETISNFLDHVGGGNNNEALIEIYENGVCGPTRKRSVFWSMMCESRVYKGVLLTNDLKRCSARAGSV